MLHLAFCILLSKLNEHCIYLPNKKAIPSATNRGSGPPLLWPLTNDTELCHQRSDNDTEVHLHAWSSSSSSSSSSSPQKTSRETKKRKLLKKKVTRVGKVIDWAKNHRQLSLSSRLFEAYLLNQSSYEKPGSIWLSGAKTRKRISFEILSFHGRCKCMRLFTDVQRAWKVKLTF